MSQSQGSYPADGEVAAPASHDGSGSVIAQGLPVFSFGLTRWVIAIVLLASALLKGYALATGPAPGSTWLDTRFVQILAVELELLIAWLLISGFALRQLRLICVGLFVLFGSVAAYKLWLGETSCGCFGRVSVNPLWTLLLDIILATWAGFSRALRQKDRCDVVCATPSKENQTPQRIRLPQLGSMACYGAMMIPLTYFMATYTPGVLTVKESDAGHQGWTINGREGDFVLLEPEQWVGQRFPLFELIDGSDIFRTGTWTVVLFRSDCPHCREIMPGMIREAQLAGEQVALVEMPPFATPHRVWWPTSGQGLWAGRISDRYDWFIQSPGIVELSDGIVQSASEGSE